MWHHLSCHRSRKFIALPLPPSIHMSFHPRFACFVYYYWKEEWGPFLSSNCTFSTVSVPIPFSSHILYTTFGEIQCSVQFNTCVYIHVSTTGWFQCTKWGLQGREYRLKSLPLQNQSVTWSRTVSFLCLPWYDWVCWWCNKQTISRAFVVRALSSSRE